MVGRFETTARFGAQFRVARYTEVAPATLEGLRRYLGSGLIKGIGPELASRIVDRFGIETLEILDRDPARIGEVPGIGQSRARAVRDAWDAQRQVREVMVFLQGYGVSPAFAARIYKRYGAASIARVRENPYRLAFDVWGIGFLSADKLAAALGVARDAPARLEAGVRHVLDEESAQRPRLRSARALCAEGGGAAGGPEEAGRRAIDRLARAGEVAIDASVGRGRARRSGRSTRRALPRRDGAGGRARAAARRRRAPALAVDGRQGASPGTSARRGSRSRASRPRRSSWRSQPRSPSSPADPASARPPSCAASFRS